MVCCSTPQTPSTAQTTNPSGPLTALGAGICLLWIGYATAIFPGGRACTWFELCTDGFSPDWLASDAQDVVGSHWQHAKDHGYLKEVSTAVVKHLSNWDGGDVLELAAGSGYAPAVWHDIFQEADLCTRTLLTDIQPKTKTWEALRKEKNALRTMHEDFSFECGTFSYVASSVDATEAQAALEDIVPTWGLDGKEIRMIHLSLHHFEPNLVHQILEDATRANAAVLIVDHSPNAGGALYNGALGLKQLIKLIPGILMRNPIKVLLAPAVPIIIAGLWHDATVSILRSYSQTELHQMIRATEEGKHYNIQSFRSASYGEWIGIPTFLRLPFMDDHVMNFVFATPTGEKSYKKHHVNSPAESNGTVEPSRVYGTPIITESPPVSASMQMALLLLVGIVSYKTLIDDKAPKKKRKLVPALGDSGLIGKPAILAVGTSNPPHEWTIEHVEAALQWFQENNSDIVNDDFIPFMRRVHKTSGVDTRKFGDPPPSLEALARGEMPTGMYARKGSPGVDERRDYWAKWAPKMAIEASTKAIANWGGRKEDITHVIFHSCTGFKAPGVELDVVDALKLTGVRRRLGINYMGCFGGFTGMSVAKAFCEADPTATVLVVCAETCYAHISLSDNRSKSIGNCFFADGGAAAIIGAGRPGDWAITDQQTKTLGTETRELMTWRPSSFNYDMYLDKGIGLKFGMHLYWNMKSYLRSVCSESATEIEWCVHPGGKGILDFFCSDKLGLGITKETLGRSYDVLKRHGNMSSGTIFFVLEDLMKEAREHPTEIKPTAVCFGFGPGLTLEIAELRRIGSDSSHS
ncbi:Chalcone synthase [Seminavis robusta]|uniref:Chalcone synthase n=1 Tax=Seminavis robusta TaxID=568900 RepID=A0A9N8DE64_9STRA|nr:Chalcone synthase [Seminavis robusta]|eukprot:Sro98_g050330.1 Chalcone synthase (806) ;mRNA; r:23010-25427